MINFQNLSSIGNRCIDVDSALQLTLELIFIEIYAMNSCFTGVCIWSSIQNQAFTNWVTCIRSYAYTKIGARFWFFCIEILWICPCVRLFFSTQCLVASSSHTTCCHACSLAAVSWFFCSFVFIKADFVAQS